MKSKKEDVKIRVVRCPWCGHVDKIYDKPTVTEHNKVYAWQCSGCKGNIGAEFWRQQRNKKGTETKEGVKRQMKNKLEDDEYELARLSNMPVETPAQRLAVKKYAQQCDEDGEQNDAEQQEEADEQVGE
jgi:hypothetical protein